MYRKSTSGWFKHWDFMVWDLLCLQAAFIAACWLRLGILNPYTDPTYRSMGILIELFDLVVLLMYGTLTDVLKRDRSAELVRTCKHVIWLGLVCVLYMYAGKIGANYSRVTMFLTFLIYAVLTFLVRILWRSHLIHRTGESADRTMVVMTTSDQAAAVIRALQEKEYGYIRIVGLVLMDEDRTGEEIEGIPVVASRDEAASYICREWVDEVFLRYPAEMELPRERILQLAESGVVIHMNIEDRIGQFGQQQLVEHIGGYTVLTSTINSMNHRQAFLKRTMDIVGGLVGCLITGILFIFLAPAIYILSPGPIFFKQTRIGRNGRKFQMYKFRSMYVDAEERKAALYAQNEVADGMMFKMDFDPRVIGNRILPDGTKKRGLGDFMRRCSLDEFPQFFNVLKGEMSLVGTRPPTVDEWEKYELHHRARLAIKPGITGMWQVSGRSDIRDFEEVVRLDLKYINEWSIGLDIRILLKTVKNVLTRKGAA